ncbi:hypothetical protein NVP1215B_052 [Vibrio phage 1.215.B._10N.222.54.F7]|nr:hypothetical protein NVP1215A_052 [Vibrio phage 1.215.A._10N.222.54.F7]AUR96075.1 hypothetical protein NVP1215B_052 [Vibrio phage 1.215.B._10N.222.54.F7]
MKCNIKPVDLTLRAFRKYRTALQNKNGLNALSTPATPSNKLKSQILRETGASHFAGCKAMAVDLASGEDYTGFTKMLNIAGTTTGRFSAKGSGISEIEKSPRMTPVLLAGSVIPHLINYRALKSLRRVLYGVPLIRLTGDSFMPTFKIESGTNTGFKNKSSNWETRGLVLPDEYLYCDPAMPDIDPKGGYSLYSTRKLIEALTRLLGMASKNWKEGATEIERGNLVYSALIVVLNYMSMRVHMTDGRDQLMRAIAPLAALFYYNSNECSPHEVARCLVTAINNGLIHLSDPAVSKQGISWPRLIVDPNTVTPVLLLKQNGTPLNYSVNPFEHLAPSLHSTKEEGREIKTIALNECSIAPNIIMHYL